MSAPIQEDMRPFVYRCKLGAFEVTAILDSTVIRNGLTPSYGGEALRREVQELARANRIDADRYEHPFIPLLVNTGAKLVLFDTGNGALARDHEQFRGRLPEGCLRGRMLQAGYRPDDVDLVVITHGHPDHIGGLSEQGSPAFPNARYVFGAAEFDFWKRGENVREARKFHRDLFVRIAGPLAERSDFIKPGDEIVPGIRAIDAAGHSPGMLAYLIESQGKRLLNWADTCGHYVMGVQRPDIHLDVDDDKDRALYPKASVLAALRQNPRAAEAFMAILAHEIMNLRTRLEQRNIRSARDRARHFLALNASADGRTVLLHRSLKDLAAELGLTHESFYRALADLAANGEIKRFQNKILLRDTAV